MITPAPLWSRFRALGTGVAVGVADDDDALHAAVAEVRAEIREADLAASRFRPDSELVALNSAAGGRPVRVGPWLLGALEDALDAADATDGIVDPGLGAVMVAIGYQRSFDRVVDDPAPIVELRRRPGWTGIEIDAGRSSVRVPSGVALDLGATAKARAADRAARRAHDACGTGVLVSIGGDISVCGPAPAGGWPVLVTDRSDTPPEDSDRGQTVGLHVGGLATSGTTLRRWRRGGVEVHHLVDPRTGRPAVTPWRTVSVSGSTCLAANVAATASVVLGDGAPAWLAARGHHARLVGAHEVVTVGDWPVERPAA